MLDVRCGMLVKVRVRVLAVETPVWPAGPFRVTAAEPEGWHSVAVVRGFASTRYSSLKLSGAPKGRQK